MIYTAIDTFYLTEEQLKNSPSRKDGIDEATETILRIYGCDLIQESGILLKLYPFMLFFQPLYCFHDSLFLFHICLLYETSVSGSLDGAVCLQCCSNNLYIVRAYR